MKCKLLSFLILAMIILFSFYVFAQDAPKFRLIRVEPEKTAGTEEDGLELYRPETVIYNKYNDQLYVTDTKNHRIVILNTDLEFVSAFGSHGQGPGEFDNPQTVAFNRTENFFVFDLNNRRVNIYDSQYKFLNSFRLPGGFRPYFDYLFNTDSKGRLFMNFPSLGHVVTIFNSEGNITGGIENIGSVAETVKGRFDNRCLGVIDDDDYLYCFFTDQMIIRKYNIATEKPVKETSYEFIPWVKDRKKGFDKNRGNASQYLDYQLAREISYDADHLFVRFSVINPEKGNQQKVYVFDKDLNVKPDVLSIGTKALIDTEFNHPDYYFTLDRVFCKIHRFNKKEVSCLKK